MSSNNVCPNCGAPKVFNIDNKCQYCGTILLDMAMVDFDSYQPVFLKIKHNGTVRMIKCIPTSCNVNISPDTSSLYCDNKIVTTLHRQNIDISLDFHGVD